MLSGVLLPFVTVSQGTDGLVTTAKEICWATTVDCRPMARPEGKATAPVVSSKAAVAVSCFLRGTAAARRRHCGGGREGCEGCESRQQSLIQIEWGCYFVRVGWTGK